MVSNTIVSGSTAGYGIYFESASAGISYCDFHNNVSSDFGGSTVPPFVGQLALTNANGDSCDVYMNIYENPRYRSASGPFAFRLTRDSPCIDAGNPNSPLDPDSTIADIGAYYFHQSVIAVTLLPHNPPVVIPAGGGFFRYDAGVVNNSGEPVSFDVWTMVTLPGGNIYGPLLLRQNLTIPGGGRILRTLSQLVPSQAPPGDYTYFGCLGVYPDSITDVDSLYFCKLSGGVEASQYNDWLVIDRFIDSFEDGFEREEGDFHPEAVELSASPNPFNASTVISFELRDAVFIKLAVYDVNGREAAALADGWMPAGRHSIVLDASSLPSGIYFARMTAGDLIQTRKLLQLK